MTPELLYDRNLLEKIDPNTLPGFYDSSMFDFLSPIEHGFQNIHDEWLSVTSKQNFFQPWPQEKIINQIGNWITIPIRSRIPPHKHTEDLMLRSEWFPTTLKILTDSLSKRLCDVTFSCLRPGAVIHPHHGRFSNTLRCHLGLQIPKDDCKIKVNGETRTWQQGKILVLDDRLEHEAWNLTDQDRTVLIFDFIPDQIPGFFPYNQDEVIK